VLTVRDLLVHRSANKTTWTFKGAKGAVTLKTNGAKIQKTAKGVAGDLKKDSMVIVQAVRGAKGNAAIDALRRRRFSVDQDEAIADISRAAISMPGRPDLEEQFRDEELSMIFMCCHPRISRDATREAQDLIRNDTKTALEIYKEITGDKTGVDDLLAWLKEPGMMEWNLEPQGTMKFASHLFKTGTLKTQPKAWTDYYLPVAHDLKGN
jgi:hypothetical protein